MPSARHHLALSWSYLALLLPKVEFAQFLSRSCTSLRLRWHRGFLGIAGVPCTSKGRQFRDCASISQPSALQRKTGHEHKFYCIRSLGATGKVPIGSSNSKIVRASCSCSAAPPLRHCTALLFSTQVHPRSQVQLRAPWAFQALLLPILKQHDIAI